MWRTAAVSLYMTTSKKMFLFFFSQRLIIIALFFFHLFVSPVDPIFFSWEDFSTGKGSLQAHGKLFHVRYGYILSNLIKAFVYC
jgi:hypothetical protein